MNALHWALKRSGWLFVAALIGLSSWSPASLVKAYLDSPVLNAIQPARAANDVDMPVEISGSGFSNAGGLPQVFLGAVPLPEVAWESESKLTAMVPWGLDPGPYSLRVVNPDGGEATLDPAFEVTLGIGQWNANTMDGGPVQTIIPVPSIPGLLYAYSEATYGLYKSTDSGAHWTTVGHAPGHSFVIDPSDPDTMYLNNLRSTDGGVTWQDMLVDRRWPGSTDQPGYYTQVFPHPTTPGTIFLAAAEIPAANGDLAGLLRSKDYGQTWEKAMTGLLFGDVHVTALEFFGNTIYLGTQNGNLYQSSNGGDSWTRIGSSNVLPSIGLLKVNPHDPTELWIVTHYAVTAHAQMARMELVNPYPVTPISASAWPTDRHPKTMGFLDADTLFVANQWDRGYISEDDGATWGPFHPSTGKPGNWLVLDPWDLSKNTFYMADERYGVQKTTDRGVTWTPVYQGLHAMTPDYLVIDPANPAHVYAKIIQNGWPGIFISADGGQNWTFSPIESDIGSPQPITNMVAVNGKRVFVGAHGNDVLGMGPQLFISEDQGSTWTRKEVDPAPAFPESFHMPGVLKADPQQPDTLLLTAVIGNRDLAPDQYVSEIYRSTDNGDTWQRINLVTKVGHPVKNLQDIAFDPHNSNLVYASAAHELLKSSDNGLTWSVVKADNAANLGLPIAIEPVAPYRVYVGNLVSTDEGATWMPASLPFPVTRMVFVPGSDILYGSGFGLIYSYNGGTTWQIADGALASTKITSLAVGKIDQRIVIYIGTPGGTAAAANSGMVSFISSSAATLEAGVYRMTQVWKSVYLPLIQSRSH